MENLIPMGNRDGKIVVSSRRIAEDFGKQHKDVLESIERITAENPALTANMFIPSSYKAGTGKSYKEYELTRDGFSLLVMGFTGSEALQWKLKYIDTFNKMEKAIIKFRDSYMIEDPVERAKAWIHEEEKRQALADQIEADKPKVIFANSVSGSVNSILIRELAKMIRQNGVEIGEKRLFQWLRSRGFLISKAGLDYNSPTQYSMNLGLMEVKEVSIDHASGYTEAKRTPLITGKGQQYFINKLLQETRCAG